MTSLRRGALAWTCALTTTLPFCLNAMERSPEHEADIAELEAMIDPDANDGRRAYLSPYHLDFQPSNLERIIVSDPAGKQTVYHYITFRLRNRVVGETGIEFDFDSHYNELLSRFAGEHEGVDFADRRLALEGDDDPILEREALRERKRRVHLTAMAYDENGSRFRLLDDVPGTGPQENFNFEDQGVREVSMNLSQVRERIEEAKLRRLLLPAEISDPNNALLPFDDSSPIDEETGWRQGELWGVFIFDRLTPHGDRFTVRVHGLSNQYFRRETPGYDAWDLDDRKEVPDYYGTRLYRKIYVIEYDRPGDEFYRGSDPITLITKGWRYVPVFERISTRKTWAECRYHRHNVERIMNDNSLNDAFWKRYNTLRQSLDELPDMGK